MSVSARKTQMEENLAKSSAARSGSPEGQSENGIGGVQGSSFPLLGRSNARAKLHSKSASFGEL